MFDDLWQSVKDATGWIEVGTSFCDQGSPAAKWVYAYYTPATGYYESVIQYNIPTGTTHKFKIRNYSTTYWAVYIDDSAKASGLNFGYGGSVNRADVGLDVTPSRISSTQDSTSETGLLNWKTSTWVQSWSGADYCRDSSSHIYPQWIGYDWWRHSLNVSLPVSSCSP